MDQLRAGAREERRGGGAHGVAHEVDGAAEVSHQAVEVPDVVQEVVGAAGSGVPAAAVAPRIRSEHATPALGEGVGDGRPAGALVHEAVQDEQRLALLGAPGAHAELQAIDLDEELLHASKR